jgi:hypothetical protein
MIFISTFVPLPCKSHPTKDREDFSKVSIAGGGELSIKRTFRVGNRIFQLVGCGSLYSICLNFKEIKKTEVSLVSKILRVK